MSYFDKTAADFMAAVVDDMIRRGQLDARSALGDARLDYGEPFSDTERIRILCRDRAPTNRRKVLELLEDEDGAPYPENVQAAFRLRMEDVREWSDQDPLVEVDREAERLDPGHLGRVNAQLRRELSDRVKEEERPCAAGAGALRCVRGDDGRCVHCHAKMSTPTDRNVCPKCGANRSVRPGHSVEACCDYEQARRETRSC